MARIIGFIFIAVAFVSGCATTEYGTGTHTQDIYFYSTEKEVAIGQSISKQLEKQVKLSRNPTDLEKINRIGAKIAAVCDRKEINYYFSVIEEKEVNAFSVPGGYVYVYKGLIDLLSEDELAYVVAHEVSHIVSRHSIKKLQAAMGANLLILATSQAKTSPGFHQGLSFALGQLFAAYSREDEFNADELACKYLNLAGLDPSVGIRVLDKLYLENKKASLRKFSYFRTHPYVDQRIRHIKEYLGLPLDVKDYINQ
ncbi:MAG: M48 family metalloprotease [Candidatus Omnitrophota bacterium]